MELFQQTFSMFKPFAPGAAGRPATATPEPEPDASAAAPADSNIDDLRQQMKDMQERLEKMSKKDE
jgi:polyhydroxyalkanoate synthesis regulator protein